MGWTIPYIAGPTDMRSYGVVDAALDATADHVAPKYRDALQLLRPTGPAEITLTPTQAAHVADALESVHWPVTARITKRHSVELAAQIAAAARTAARSGRPWHWT